MLLRILAVLFGIGFIFLGVAGFLPEFMPNGLLLGMFQVDFLHNAIHLVSGVIAIMCALTYRHARLFFQVFGIFYLVFALVGFIWGGDLGFLAIPSNTADNILHVIIAIISLYFGFFLRRTGTSF